MARKKSIITKELHYCRECVHCTIVDKPTTFSVKKEPTLGKCPFWKESPCVLLSQLACEDNFEMKDGSGQA